MARAKLVLGLGSNLGDRAAQLRAAGRALVARRLIEGALWSSIHETAPIGPPQGMFLNQVVSGVTRWPAVELLAALQDIERQAGRVRGERWGPRRLDLDILVHGDACVASRELTIPHPGIRERSFVLGPWAELEPCYAPPGLEIGVAALLARLESSGRAGRCTAPTGEGGRA